MPRQYHHHRSWEKSELSSVFGYKLLFWSVWSCSPSVVFRPTIFLFHWSHLLSLVWTNGRVMVWYGWPRARIQTCSRSHQSLTPSGSLFRTRDPLPQNNPGLLLEKITEWFTFWHLQKTCWFIGYVSCQFWQKKSQKIKISLIWSGGIRSNCMLAKSVTYIRKM